RAASLPPIAEGRRARLLGDLAATLMDAGDLDEAERVLADALAQAANAGDENARARALVEGQFLELRRAASGATQGVRGVVERVVPLLYQAGDEHGLCRARQLEASAAWLHGRISAAADAWEQAAEHAQRAGEEHKRADILWRLASSTWFGAMP